MCRCDYRFSREYTYCGLCTYSGIFFNDVQHEAFRIPLFQKVCSSRPDGSSTDDTDISFSWYWRTCRRFNIIIHKCFHFLFQNIPWISVLPHFSWCIVCFFIRCVPPIFRIATWFWGEQASASKDTSAMLPNCRYASRPSERRQHCLWR